MVPTLYISNGVTPTNLAFPGITYPAKEAIQAAMQPTNTWIGKTMT